MAHPLRGKTACVGVATAGTGEAPGRNAMEIMVEAVHGALADAQIPLSEVDGLFAATAFHSMANMSLAEHLGIQPAYSNGSNIGGSSFMMHALDAAMALEAGLINVAVIAYGSNQRTAGGFRSISEPPPFEFVYGPRNPDHGLCAGNVALHARIWLHSRAVGRGRSRSPQMGAIEP